MMPTPDELILAILSVEPQHGYQLLEAFRDPDRLAYIWDMSTAQVYAVLNRLERNKEILGLIIEEDNAPARTEFRTTGRGRARVRAWLDEADPSASIRRVRVDFLSRIYAAQLLGEPIEPMAQRQLTVCERERDRLAALLVTMESEPARMALALQVAQLDAVLTWIKATFGTKGVS